MVGIGLSQRDEGFGVHSGNSLGEYCEHVGGESSDWRWVLFRYFLRFVEHAEKTFAAQVSQRIEALKTNAFAVERANGLPSDAVRSVLRGTKKSGTTLNKAQEVCDALGLELYFGPRRDPGPSVPEPFEIDGQDFAAIPRVDAEASAGQGAVNDDVEVVGTMAFRRDWLRDHGVKPERALLVTVTGDSMTPSIQPGDVVLLDRDRTAIVNGKPFIFTDADGETRLKRLHRLGRQTLALVSDNPNHPPELRNGIDAERIKVLGQIVWSGHNWA